MDTPTLFEFAKSIQDQINFCMDYLTKHGHVVTYVEVSSKGHVYCHVDNKALYFTKESILTQLTTPA